MEFLETKKTLVDIIEQTVNIFRILRKKLKKLESENQELRNNPTVLEKDKRIQQLHQIIKKRNATIEELLETIDKQNTTIENLKQNATITKIIFDYRRPIELIATYEEL